MASGVPRHNPTDLASIPEGEIGWNVSGLSSESRSPSSLYLTHRSQRLQWAPAR